MKNKYINFCLKALAAAVLAFIALNLICGLYYNLAIHSHSKTGSTDYVWQKNKFYSRGTEGFACGVTDGNGFNNLQTYPMGEMDVLIMGSSHMEAFNVAQTRSTAAVLNKNFAETGMEMDVYNIGVSGHTLERCLNNAENAIEEFRPAKYLVIETNKVNPDVGDMRDVLEGKLEPIESNNGGIIGELQEFPFLRRCYGQLKSVLGDDDKDDDDDEQGDSIAMLEQFLSKLSKKCEEQDIRIIMVYNCGLDIDEKGNVIEQKDTEQIEEFNQVCFENNVTFINMYNPFKTEYLQTRKLPHGFSNSKVGTGHLNGYGHRVIADQLFEVICRLEEK